MAGLGAGPRCGTDALGQYKTHGIGQSIRAQRGRARSALSLRVKTKNNNHNLCSVFICCAEKVIALRTKGLILYLDSMLEFIGSWHLLQFFGIFDENNSLSVKQVL